VNIFGNIGAQKAARGGTFRGAVDNSAQVLRPIVTNCSKKLRSPVADFGTARLEIGSRVIHHESRA
jgi:hypothetical protein